MPFDELQASRIARMEYTAQILNSAVALAITAGARAIAELKTGELYVRMADNQDPLQAESIRAALANFREAVAVARLQDIRVSIGLYTLPGGRPVVGIVAEEKRAAPPEPGSLSLFDQ